MADNKICKRCGKYDDCNLPCEALNEVYKLYEINRDIERRQILDKLKKDLDILDAEVNEELFKLSDAIINKYSHLHFIKDFDIRIGFVSCNEAKKDKGKIINAECIKVKPWQKAYLPYDYVIVFYEYNISHMSENQRKVLLMHELQHIEIGDRGLKVRVHDVEDFNNILRQFGLNWNGYDADIPDILGGELDGTKRNELDTEP